MKVEVHSVIGANLSEKSEDKSPSSEGAKISHLAPQPPPSTSNQLQIMTTTFARIPTVPEDDPRRSYDGFTPHPEVPIESTSILYAMEDDEFEWNQGWIDLYWAEVDETLRIREEELRNRRAGEKRKRSGRTSEGPEKKKLKVSNNYFLLLSY